MDDRYPRSKKTEATTDALARVMRANGLTVPQHLDEIMSEAPVVPLPTPRHPTPRDRVDRLVTLGWPRRAIDFALDGHDTAAIETIRTWDRSRNVIMMVGAKGTGKTVAAAWCALHWPAIAPFRFVRVATLVRIGRFNDRKGTEPVPPTVDGKERLQWSDYIAAPMLCVDDLGAEYLDSKGSFVADLDELVDTFYADRRPLVITTNLDGEMIRKRYGGRMVDRLKECAVWANVTGESMR